MRIAVIDQEKCRPSKCGRVCYKYCPPVRMGKETITFDAPEEKAVIHEELCSGCGICVKKCPFRCIQIINLPEELDDQVTHRYSINGFKLHRLPMPVKGSVTGLVGQNGSGKTTTLNILMGELRPNLGQYEDPPEWDEVIKHYAGTVIQDYFTKLVNDELRVVKKPQSVDRLPRVVKGKVSDLISKVDERGIADEIKEEFSLTKVWNRNISKLSGGELQRLTIAATVMHDADVYLFDEPTSYLDVNERVRIAQYINDMRSPNRTIVVVEHDLAMLDYLSENIHLYYGEAGAYGIVSQPMSVREGINVFLDGYIPSENMRFRDSSIVFRKASLAETSLSHRIAIRYGDLTKKFDSFTLSARGGELHKGEVVGIIGPNGIGKTTFVKILAGALEPTTLSHPIELLSEILEKDKKIEEEDKSKVIISHKPQYLYTESEETVEEYLKKINPTILTGAWFRTELIRPLDIEKLKDQQLKNLSGGELQRVSIAGCLARKAHLYLLDEPSAYISAEDRVSVARVINRIISHYGATAFVVEHDVMMLNFLSDRLMVFSGIPGVRGESSPIMSLQQGMNTFLRTMGITFRQDPKTLRPRVNKKDSQLDKKQKAEGRYFVSA
ncbi:MAG: ribosome biogenesis/translation initiation ATPase RLI [Candidatus Heimdallarchaeaceae archaeon]